MEHKRGEENMGKIIILGSEKGGVAKTTSTFNLAYALAEEGKKVLAVDFDSQANLSTCFGIEDTAAVPVTVGHHGGGWTPIFVFFDTAEKVAIGRCFILSRKSREFP